MYQILSEDTVLDKDDLESASEFISRTQMLFATLLPFPPVDRRVPTETVEKTTVLLPHGVPTPDQDYQSALQIAKSSSRFGLLLVGNELT